MIESLAVNEQEKILDLEEFFNRINVRNNQLIRIKKNMTELLQELVENKIIRNELEIILKSGKKYCLIKLYFTIQNRSKIQLYCGFNKSF